MVFRGWSRTNLVAIVAVLNILGMTFIILCFVITDRFPPRQTLSVPAGNSLVGMTPDGKILVTKSMPEGNPTEVHGPLRLWDVPTGKERAAYLPGVLFYPTHESVLLSPDGELLAVNYKDGILRILDVATGDTVSEIPFIDPNEEGLLGSGLSLFSPDSRKLAFRSRKDDKEFVNLWDRESKNSRTLFDGKWRTPLAFTRDGETLVTFSLSSSSSDKTDLPSKVTYISKMELWDLTVGQVRHSYDQEGLVHKAVFAPDGRLVVITDDEARFIDKDTGKSLWVLPNVKSLVFYPGGERLLTDSFVWPNIKCWDLATEKLEFEFRSESFPVLLIPDGKTLVTRANDQTFQFWDVPPKKPLWWLLAWTAFPAAMAVWQLIVLIRCIRHARSQPTVPQPSHPV